MANNTHIFDMKEYQQPIDGREKKTYVPSTTLQNEEFKM
jgi:hypothetical protein